MGSGCARVSRTFHPCFLAVAMTERRLEESKAPCIERKPPEIFWRQLPIRRSRSAALLGERRSRVGEESQAPFLVLPEPEPEVVTNASLFSSALSALERRNIFVTELAKSG